MRLNQSKNSGSLAFRENDCDFGMTTRVTLKLSERPATTKRWTDCPLDRRVGADNLAQLFAQLMHHEQWTNEQEEEVVRKGRLGAFDFMPP